VPCRIGSQRGFELIHTAILDTKDKKIEPNLFSDLLHTLEKGSLCGLGAGLPLPVNNILEYFKDELKPYFRGLR